MSKHTTAAETPILDGERIRLEPLSRNHLSGLAEIAFEPEVWRYMLTRVSNRSELEAWIESAFAANANGQIVWTTLLKAENRVVGSTRLIDLDMRHRTAEIGHTWISPRWHGANVNPEAKLLQLRYAFDDLGLNRVAFKTHHQNAQSQAAIRKLGAVYEGTFRNHYVMPDGSLRHSVWFSITREDWPQVRSRLEDRLRAVQPSA
jgi:RimJ/RimL family protein N-acetyltransferase